MKVTLKYLKCFHLGKEYLEEFEVRLLFVQTLRRM